MHNQRVVRRPALGGVDRPNSLLVPGVGPEPCRRTARRLARGAAQADAGGSAAAHRRRFRSGTRRSARRPATQRPQRVWPPATLARSPGRPSSAASARRAASAGLALAYQRWPVGGGGRLHRLAGGAASLAGAARDRFASRQVADISLRAGTRPRPASRYTILK